MDPLDNQGLQEDNAEAPSGASVVPQEPTQRSSRNLQKLLLDTLMTELESDKASESTFKMAIEYLKVFKPGVDDNWAPHETSDRLKKYEKLIEKAER